MAESGWGEKQADGEELWLAEPACASPGVIGRLKYFLNIKKSLLFSFLHGEPTDRILDLGCGTAGNLIDLERRTGAQMVGCDVFWRQALRARSQLEKYDSHASLIVYEGDSIPFDDESFSGVYCSDVLGHVPDPDRLVFEVARVLRPGGRAAIFTESELASWMWLERYLSSRGIEIDSHAEFHISLLSKAELKELFSRHGFRLRGMFGVYLLRWLLCPHWYYPHLKQHRDRVPRWLRYPNAFLYHLRRLTNPLFDLAVKLWSFPEALILGRWIPSQGYLVLLEKPIDPGRHR